MIYSKQQAIDELNGINIPTLNELRKTEFIQDDKINTHTQRVIQFCDKIEKEIEYLILTGEPIEQTVKLIGQHTIKLNILIEQIDCKSKLYKFLVNKWKLFI